MLEVAAVSDAAFALATNIVWLACSRNRKITTLPFSASLRHLVAQYDSSFGVAALTTATNLVTLDCGNNPNITSLAFCATSLQELTAWGYICGVCGDDIVTMGPQLWKVEKWDNHRITVQHLEGFTAMDGNGSVYVRTSSCTTGSSPIGNSFRKKVAVKKCANWANCSLA